MSKKGSGASKSLNIPGNWRISHFTAYFEGEDLSDDPAPFAANVVVQMRLDVEPGADLDAVVDADLENVRSSSDFFEIVKRTVKKKTAEVEWICRAGPQTLRQVAVYQTLGGSMYTLIGSHKEDRFESVRKDMATLTSRLIEVSGGES
jgi:hypothetical protein